MGREAEGKWPSELGVGKGGETVELWSGCKRKVILTIKKKYISKTT